MRGQDLKEWRESQRLSQKELANELDVSRHSVINWEGMETVPKLVQLAISFLDYNSEKSLMVGRPSSMEEIDKVRKSFDKIIDEANIKNS